MKSRCLLILTSIVLSACVSGPEYQQPEHAIPDLWNTQLAAQAEARSAASPVLSSTDPSRLPIHREDAIKTDWWQVFNDPLLEKYIALASLENKDVLAARANLNIARAKRNETDAKHYPQVDARSSITRSGSSRSDEGSGSRRTEYTAGLDASWEIDFFGGIKRENEAAQARLEQSLVSQQAVLLATLSETARSYYTIRGVQKRIAIIHANIALQQSTFELIQNLFNMGEATEFDLTRAQAQLQLTKARLPDLDADLKSGIFRLSVLLGQQPETLMAEMLDSKPLPAPPDMVPVGLRSDILRRRPDVRIAERELAAATADIGVAIADLYPRFSLTGSVGRSASIFSDLFEADSNVFSIGPLLRWPVFQAGAIRANIKVQEAEAELAAIRYEQTVLNSLADAESALSRYAQKLKTTNSLKRALISNERSTELARLLYNSGEENFLSVLDAERELSNVKDALVISETDTILNLIALYAALGGGWELFASDDSAAHVLQD